MRIVNVVGILIVMIFLLCSCAHYKGNVYSGGVQIGTCQYDAWLDNKTQSGTITFYDMSGQ